ncbi:Ig-like domain-containing protein, partial [Bacillus sp. JJ1566]|uniref:Ig-like domain-containing protein n=1 Tax=Bacillus sp. JJ1566 TaxID=3122961 RepID=UPI002FFEE3FC
GANISYYNQYSKVEVVLTNIFDSSKEIPNASVRISDSGGSATNENGHFTFTRVWPGNHTIEVHAEGYEPITREIRVLSGQRINLNISLTPSNEDSTVTNGVIAGIVKDENGVPIKGVKIYTHNANPVYSDFSGYYSLPVEEGTYTVMFEAKGYHSVKTEPVNVTKGSIYPLDTQLSFSMDVTKPTWPEEANLSISDVSENAVTLSWGFAADNDQVAFYKVFVNGTLRNIVPSTVTSIIIDNLSAGTNYDFSIIAGDSSGNWTTSELKAAARTHARADLDLIFDKNQIYVNENTTVTLTAKHGKNLYGFDVSIKYDPELVDISTIKLNPSFGMDGTTASLYQTNKEGILRIVGTLVGEQEGHSGEVPLVDISVTALTKEGTANFTIKNGSSVSDIEDALYVANQDYAKSLNITNPVEGIQLSSTEMTLDTSTNKTGNLTATVIPENATNKKVLWSSTNEKVATVDQTGKVTAISAGKAKIIATTEDKGLKAESEITVISSVTGIKVNKEEFRLNGTINETETLIATVLPENATNKVIVWTTSNPTVATVSSEGVVQAVGLGTAAITATTEEGGYKASANVRVTGDASFYIESEKDIVEKGEEVSLEIFANKVEDLKQFNLNVNYDQNLFELANITLHEEFGVIGTTAELITTDKDGNVTIQGKHINDSESLKGTIGLVKLVFKAKTTTQQGVFALQSNSELIDNKDVLFLLRNPISKKIAVTNADVTGDNTVAVNDLSKIAKAFGKLTGETGYQGILDMNKDGTIDIVDIAYVAYKVLYKPIATMVLNENETSNIHAAAVTNTEKSNLKLTIDNEATFRVGDSIDVKVIAENPKDLFGAQFTFEYDPARLRLAEGKFHINESFSSFGGCVVDEENGLISCPIINTGSIGSTSEFVEIGYIPMELLKTGTAEVTLNNIKVVNSQIREISENQENNLKLIIHDAPLTSPIVDDVTDASTKVTGKSVAGALVKISANDIVIGEDLVAEDGRFVVAIPLQEAGTKLIITASDDSGNVSEATTVVVTDATAPSKPTVNDVTDKDTTVSGKAEVGATIEVKAGEQVVGSGEVKADGTFSITIPKQAAGTILTLTATDPSGNRSESATITVKQVKKSGWSYENNKWHFYDLTTGDLKKGWLNDGGTWYYFNHQGIMQTGWVQDGAVWYYFTSSGAMKTGWSQIGSTWYYFTGSGAMKTGWAQIGSTWYYFAGSGAMKTGWVYDGGSWYYIKASGAMSAGWVQVGSSWYYFANSGVMKTGWVYDGRSWYYMKSSGAMATGWAKVGSSWYYFASSGVMKTGWLLDGRTWYYMDAGGAMRTGWVLIGAKWYYFNASGVWVS